ncbi:MAG: hypothetical protein M1831_002902 [Alyxoria varia]|nr:MAG: hypothetical protein M1831_002902 [Alyxoria varia]
MDSINGSTHATTNGATNGIANGSHSEATGPTETFTAKLKEAVSSPETITDLLKNLTTSISNGASSLANGLNGTSTSTSDARKHPFDPLSAAEIDAAVEVVRREKCANGELIHFNAVSLAEPKKAEMLTWLEEPGTNPKPKRIADVVALGQGKVYDGLVDLDEEVEVEIGVNGHANGDSNGESLESEKKKKKLKGKVIKWEGVEGVQPLITLEDLQVVEGVCRGDPKVIEQCGILGIPAEDMHKVYCDPWTIGYDSRFGNKIRLQQALMYYRPHPDDSQYTYPLDFCPIFNADSHEIIHIDVPQTRRPLNKAPPSNYHADWIEKHDPSGTGYRDDIKPIHITQPEGVSFTMEGREMKWLNWRFHVGFNYREGLVLNDVRFYDRDQKRERPVFWRISLAEMVVPYGNPEHPHQRKHAFDLGEYGGGYMTNSLKLGCDCKGAITYLPAHFVTRSGAPTTIDNAICIHEEDAGILIKHSDFRDDSCTTTRARKLILSHVFTAANYEYALYWSFHMDGTIGLDIKLTGILNTYAMNEGEDLHGWGTQVYPGVNAHNHQHLFCLRVDPRMDGSTSNSVFTSDAVASDAPVGSPENYYGNAFYAKRTRFETQGEGWADYDGNTSRGWDLVNENIKNKYSGKPVGYKLVSREVPRLLPKEGSLVWRRAGFARHAVHVTKYSDDQFNPAGRHVPQTSGEPPHNPSNADLPAWIAADPSASLANADIVLWHTFGVTHFPAPEDYPIMPAEPMGLLLRPRNFFQRNPALDVRPERSVAPSQVAGKVVDEVVKGEMKGVACCGNGNATGVAEVKA